MISVITSNPGGYGLTQLIKDFQEVDLYQTASSKPFPNDLFLQVDGEVPKTSIKGDFLVQIVSIEFANPLHDDQTFLLTITDGIQTVPALTNGSIGHLKTHGKIGSKLLLTDTIPIQDGYLQLNGENTQFHYGSNTYPRPRSAFRGRTSYRNGDGRRNHRYDNDDGENNFVKRPPPKTTLIDFMPQLKISVESENEKTKERNGKRRTNTNETTNPPSKDQIVYEQDIVNDEPADNDDDPTHGAFRERRNPLPPRLQRVQEERSRRNPTRFPDDIAVFNGLYPTAEMSYLTGNSSTHNPFVQHATPLAYLPYGLTPMATQGYPTDQTNFHYGTTQAFFVAPPTLMSNGHSTEHSSIENEEKKISSEQQQNDESNEQMKKTPSNDQQTSDEKRREANARPRWKVGDFCLARWSEDGEFYYATILQIQPPFCNIVFTEYNTHDKVHFNDMKIAPRDQHYYEYYPPSLVPTSEYNPYVTNGCYPIGLDGCLIMPEVPPFPFNSDGTLYMCPSPLTTTSFTRSNQQQQQQRRRDPTNSTAAIKEDEMPDVSSSSSSLSKAKPCSIADSPLVLVTADDLRENSSKENN